MYAAYTVDCHVVVLYVLFIFICASTWKLQKITTSCYMCMQQKQLNAATTVIV